MRWFNQQYYSNLRENILKSRAFELAQKVDSGVVESLNLIELPSSFPSPKFHYEVDQFRRNVYRICIVNDGTFSY